MQVEPLNTISGSSAVTCDPIPLLLAERLENLSHFGPLFDALKNDHFSKSLPGSNKPECELEVEVRLGYIQNLRSEQRFSLPLTTDTLLASRAPVKFVPGVSEEQYNVVKNFLVDASECENRDKEWSSVVNISTLNRFFEIPGYEELVRISVPNESFGHPKTGRFEAVRKVQLLKWNISSGSTEQLNEDLEENDSENVLDYRISVNLEYKVPLTNLPTTSNAKHCRIRQRDSFANNNGKVIFDLSRVENVTDTKETTTTLPPSFEVELELFGDEIVKTLENSNLNAEERLNRLKYHCSTLINCTKYVMDLLSKRSERLKYSGFLNSIAEKIGVYDLRIASQSFTSVERYKRFLSPQLPLIGDYFYRVVAKNVENNSELYKDKKSLYTQEIETIPGPFIVKIGQDGHRFVTLG